ncbi:MAG: hypothetical protein ABL308_10705 [Oceanicaulis sp.]
MASHSAGPQGVLAGLIIAPAFGAVVCVAAMMVHFVLVDPDGAALPLGELLPMAGAIWLSALMFAYPAALVFLLLRIGFGAIGFGIAGGWISGMVAGFAAMGVYLDRVHPGGFLEGLAGGTPPGALTLPELGAALALPAIGAGSGLIAALVFASFARR